MCGIARVCLFCVVLRPLFACLACQLDWQAALTVCANGVKAAGMDEKAFLLQRGLLSILLRTTTGHRYQPHNVCIRCLASCTASRTHTQAHCYPGTLCPRRALRFATFRILCALQSLN